MSDNTETVGTPVVTRNYPSGEPNKTKNIEITPKYVYDRLAGFFFSTCALVFSVLSFVSMENDPILVYVFYSLFLIGTVGYSLLLGDFIGYFLLHASDRIRRSYVIHKKFYEYGTGCIGVLIGSTMLYLMMGDNIIPTIIGGLFFLLVSLFFDWVRKRNSKG